MRHNKAAIQAEQFNKGHLPGGQYSRQYLINTGFRDESKDDGQPKSLAALQFLARHLPGFRWYYKTDRNGDPMMQPDGRRKVIAFEGYPQVKGGHNVSLAALIDHVRRIQRGDPPLLQFDKPRRRSAPTVITKQCDAERDLGPIEDRRIQSTVGPFHRLPGYITTYPVVVIEALCSLYEEYNRAFVDLLSRHSEWPDDYRLCITSGSVRYPINCAVQIDMLGLDDAFLAEAAHMDMVRVRELLRCRIFEIENSLAMYQLLERIFERDGQPSFFKRRFRALLDSMRVQTGKPLALLAVTNPKYVAMRESEFGKRGAEPLSDAEVRELSGFDRFFGPDEFRRYVEQTGGCDYALYARTSDPIDRLKNPRMVVHHPLLADAVMRGIIKANAITFNVDDPSWTIGSDRCINDTKGYMAPMGMGCVVTNGMALHSELLANYLLEHGVQNDAVDTGDVMLRAKPLQGTYGCYGHLVGRLNDSKFQTELRHNVELRGPYIVQPEMRTPTIRNTSNGVAYTYIDRNFFGIVAGKPGFLGGFRSLMPLHTTEAQKGRIHGNGDTVWAEIVSDG